MDIIKPLSEAKIGVIGGSMGMGSWLVKFCQEHQLNVKFTSQDEKTQFQSNQELVEWADVIFLAVPIAVMTEVLEEIYPFLHQKTVIDVCSVKKFIFDKFNDLSEKLPHVKMSYCSVHPMFSQTI
ncbi:MAG: prephenate dehydrogenase/arogenate dehydrogenase family protein, partial [Flammeovirgaceae bacterium]|nr:prephenate dehydrogenase/arogenate dehydrogenase family protein [Flammeovirgaceae bacterium]